jgi:magnesium chelatase subunit D
LNSIRGRYSRNTSHKESHSKIALDATIRSAASVGYALDKNQRFPVAAIRFKQFRRREGSLFVLAIDVSGSMAAQRIRRAREVALGILRRSYLRRDSVAIVVFRGAFAKVAMPPSRSMLRAKQALDSLRLGGGTPLAAGVSCAFSITQQHKTTYPNASVLLFTDGGANVSLRADASSRLVSRKELMEELSVLGSELRQARVGISIINAQSKFVGSVDVIEIARCLGAEVLST